MNYIEEHGKKVAAVLCVASCFPVVAAVYAMETEPGWHGDRYINTDTTVATGWQEIEGKSYYFDESGSVDQKTTKKATVATVSSTVAEEVQTNVSQTTKEVVQEEVKAVEEQKAQEAVVEPTVVEEAVVQEMQKLLLEDMQNYVAELILAGKVEVYTMDDARAIINRLQKSELVISGSFDYMGIIMYGQNFTTIADMLSCQVIAESGDKKKDVALLRLNSKRTPDEIVKRGFFDINKALLDETKLVPQQEELTIIGYPAQFGTGARLVSDGKEFLPTVHRTYVSIAPDDNMFQLQSNVVGGQSGSPIIDKKRRLVGVVFGSHRGTDVAYGCNIKHLKELYDKNKARNN